MVTTGGATNPHRTGHLERTAQEPRAEIHHEARLSQIDQVNDNVRLLRLDLQSGPLPFLPGQWLDVFVPGVPKAGGFTITSAPSAGLNNVQPYLELAIQKSPGNPHAEWFWRQKEEIIRSILRIRVGGSFVFPPPNHADVGGIRKVVFLAGGVGVNPLMSMLSYISEEPRWSDTEVILLYSTKLSPGNGLTTILFLERITALFGQHKVKGQVSLHVTGVGGGEEEGTLEINGAQVQVHHHRISTKDLQEAIGFKERKSTVVYVCGPPVMTDELVEILTSIHEVGLDSQHVLTEKWW